MKRIILLSLLLSIVSASAQMRIPEEFSFDGLVYGYKNDPRKKFLSKDKEISLEGVLRGVTIKIKSGSRIAWEGKTDKGGQFEGVIPLGRLYTVTYTKPDYASGSFTLNLMNVPQEIVEGGVVFTGMELILNSYVDEKAVDPSIDFGKLYYNKSTEAMEFKPSSQDKKNIYVKNNHAHTPKDLMKGSVEINRTANTVAAIKEDAPFYSADPDKSNNNSNNKNINRPELNRDSSFTRPATSLGIEKSVFTELNLDELTADGIKDRESAIADAWEQLEKDKLLASTPEELAMIEAREELLLGAERELNKAKEIIDLQDQRIKKQRWVIFLFIILAVLLLGFLFYVYRNYKQKVKTSAIIEKKNQQITSSISYASRIQQSILLPSDEIHRIFEESFVFYAPRDVVSGDLYWFAEVGGKKIAAAMDCTGHGVPGAFMSMIGNTLMNQVIREKGLTKAATILDELHKEIVKALRQEAGNPHSNQDGMDMALCIVDPKKKEIDFAGAMNPLYVQTNGEIEIYQGTKTGIGGTIASRKMKKMGGFESNTIKYSSGSSFYMFSDGFMDQFGGENREKFNQERFKGLIAAMKDVPMNEQEAVVQETFTQWKGDEPQLDDVLLVGFRL